MKWIVRSYHQYCPMAAGLDRLGDRWTLLILRDLAWYGPARFTDLITSNPGLPPALLTERLHRLVTDGILESTKSGGYALTDRGAAVRPIVDSIAAFGWQYLVEDELTRERLEYLARRLTSLHAPDLRDVEPTTIDFIVDGIEFAFTVSPEGITVSDSTGSDMVIETDQQGLLGLVSGESGLDTVLFRGDEMVLSNTIRFLRPVHA